MDSLSLYWLQQLKVTRALLELEPQEPWRLPPHPAVTLRGAIGAAMVELCCTLPQPTCWSCERRQSCPIPGWYDPALGGATSFRPFVLRVRGADGSRVELGSPLLVELVFLGTLPRSSLVVESFCRAASEGLGPRRVPHVLRRLTVEGDGASSVVVEQDRVVGIWPDPTALSRFLPNPGPARSLILRTLTPLRLEKDLGRPSPADVLRCAIRRVRGVAAEQGVKIERRWPEPRAVEAVWEDLVLERAARWSSRQAREVRLDGWLGQASFGEGIEPYQDLLEAVRIIGLGRSTSAGLGWIDLLWK